MLDALLLIQFSVVSLCRWKLDLTLWMLICMHSKDLFCKNQLKSVAIPKYTPLTEENGNQKISTQNNQATLSQILANASTPSFYELYELGPNGSAPVWKTNKCCAYIASNSKYSVRLNSIQTFMDINRDVIIEANHLSGHSFSAHNNIIHPSAKLGSKTTVGP
ncbi:hypothetical protein SLA2020_392930 [Shorea laevis]